MMCASLFLPLLLRAFSEYMAQNQSPMCAHSDFKTFHNLYAYCSLYFSSCVSIVDGKKVNCGSLLLNNNWRKNNTQQAQRHLYAKVHNWRVILILKGPLG